MISSTVSIFNDLPEYVILKTLNDVIVPGTKTPQKLSYFGTFLFYCSLYFFRNHWLYYLLLQYYFPDFLQIVQIFLFPLYRFSFSVGVNEERWFNEIRLTTNPRMPIVDVFFARITETSWDPGSSEYVVEYENGGVAKENFP